MAKAHVFIDVTYSETAPYEYAVFWLVTIEIYNPIAESSRDNMRKMRYRIGNFRIRY